MAKKWRDIPRKKWHGIVERNNADGSIEHWYFSPLVVPGLNCGTDGYYVSGYRRYEKGPQGYVIVRRYYPRTLLLPVIAASEVPLPHDVALEVCQKGNVGVVLVG